MSTTIERFEAKIERTDTCWLWTAARSDTGYGSFGVGGKVVNAHRFAYELWIGPIPEGMQIDHLCRVRRCVNPTHLQVVTQAENIRRGESPSARLHRAGVCSRGHALVGPDADVYVRKEGKPMCRRCTRERRAAKR